MSSLEPTMLSQATETSMSSPFDRLQLLADLPSRAQQAVLPFAIAEDWQVGCAYERSAKFSSKGIFANRYLLAFSRRQVPLAIAMQACQRLAMPATARSQFARRYPTSELFYIGFEDAEDYALYKMYLEFDRGGRSGLSHLGWKWSASDAEDEVDLDGQFRVTYYRRVGCESLDQHIARLHQWSPVGDSPSRAFAGTVLEASRDQASQLVCTHVREASGRSSYDWNVYAAELSVGTFASSLAKLVASYSLDSAWLHRFLAVASTARLGHVAGGVDSMGQDFCTLYYATD